MENDILDSHRNFIENQKRQIEVANQLIKYDNEDMIRTAKELIKSCEKSIEIVQKMNKII